MRSEQVTASVARAGGACNLIRQIGEGSREAARMVSEITDAIHEQSSASTAVAQSVERIAQMAEQSTAAARASDHRAAAQCTGARDASNHRPVPALVAKGENIQQREIEWAWKSSSGLALLLAAGVAAYFAFMANREV